LSRLLGIDQGTSGTTVVALNEDLKPIASSSTPVTSIKAAPGHVEQDPWHVLNTVVESTRAVLNQIGPGHVIGGMAHQGETVLAWHRLTREPLTNAIVWSDRRSTEVVERLRRDGVAAEIETRSGLQLDPYFCAAKYSWLLETQPDLAELGEDLALTTLESWLAARLGGDESTDVGTASRTQLVELGKGSWDGQLLKWFDLEDRFLSPIADSLDFRGTLNDDSWDGSVDLWSSAVDQPAALFGNGCLDPGDLKVTYGTGAFLVANLGTIKPGRLSTLVPSVGWSDQKGPVFIVDGGVLSAGSSLAWLEQMGVDVSPEAQARVVDLDSRVHVLPAFDGLGAPHWDRDTTAAIAGLTSSTTPDDLLKGFLDAIAFRVAEIIEAYIEAGFPRPDSVTVDGGLSQSRHLMQRQADVLGIPVALGPNPESTALGATFMAGVAAGNITTDDVRAATSTRTLIEPADHSRAQDDYHRWKAFARSACTGVGSSGE
jgi:glycerol kinase